MPINFSRIEEILLAGIGREYYDDSPESRVEELLIELINNGGGGGGGGGSTVAGVTSFNGRRNRVVPQSGDYTAAMIGTATSGKSVQTYINEILNQLTFDTRLNVSSEKAVQNKVIAQAINELEGKLVPAGGRASSILMKNSDADWDTKWENTNAFMLKSVYDRNNNGRTDRSELADAVQGPIYKATLKGTRGDTTLLTDEDKGVANGVVPLDSTRKILPEYLPDSIMNGLTHGGIFNATTRVVTLSDAAKSILGITADTMTLENSPTVPQGYPANAELYYITTTDGTFANMDFVSGDWLISLGNQWQRLKNGNQVSSVNGYTGAVNLKTDDIPQGVLNLYFTAEEKAKLRGIEDGATKDVDVVQSVTKRTLPGGQIELRFANKNGEIVTYTADADVDLSEYLKKDGDGSNVKTTFTRNANRILLTGNETIAQAFSKISKWLYDFHNVAFSGDYRELNNKPQYTGDFTNNGAGDSRYPYIDKRVGDLVNYWSKDNSYSKSQVDQLLEDIEGFEVLIVTQLPTRNINQHAEYWIVKTDPETGTEIGYKRFRYVQGAWANLGDTDLNLNEYLKRNGDASQTTSSLTIPALRSNLATGDQLTTLFGKIAGWYNEFADVVWSNVASDLDDYDELALKTDLEAYLKNEFELTDEGKMLVVGSDGKLVLTSSITGGGATRRGEGSMSVIGNDTEENPVNEASGSRATAFGYGNKASGNNGFVVGKFAKEDRNSQFAFQVGGGTDDSNRDDLLDVSWDGKVNIKNQIKMGSITNLPEITDLNDVTHKYYVDATIEREIAESNLLSSMIVDAVPDVASAQENVLYLVPDPSSEGHYNQYKKVKNSAGRYIMANLGGTQISMTGTQVTRLPVASEAYSGKVYQYIGTNSAFKFGAQYTCVPVQYYGWISSFDGKVAWTDTLDVKSGEDMDPPSDLHGSPIYGKQSTTSAPHIATYVGPTHYYLDLPNRIRDTLANWYTRSPEDDMVDTWHWVPLFTELKDFAADNGIITPLSDQEYLSSVDLETSSVRKVTFENFYSYIKYKIYQTDSAIGVVKGKPAANRALISGPSQQIEASSVTSEELSYLKGVTSAIQTQLNNLNTKITDYWKTIFPIGSIYTTVSQDNPGTLFGGTWTLVGTDRVLWGVAQTTAAGGTLDEQLPDIRGHIDWKDGGQAKTEISNGSGAFNLTNKNLGAAYPTGTGASSSARGFDFRASYYNSVYKLSASVRPNAYTVHFWRRTA